MKMCVYLGRGFTDFIGVSKDSSTHKYVQNHCSGKALCKHIQNMENPDLNSSPISLSHQARVAGRVKVTVDMDIVASLKAVLYVKFPENEPKKSTCPFGRQHLAQDRRASSALGRSSLS